MRARAQNRRAGKPEMREEQLAEIGVDRLLFAALPHRHAAVAQRKALHGRAVQVRRFERDERRPKRLHRVAERFGEPRAVAVGAGAGVGSAAAREQNGRRTEHLAPVRLDAGGSAVFHADRADRAPHHRHAELFEPPGQRVCNVVRAVGDREHAVPALHLERHAERFKEAHRFFGRERLHRAVEETPVARRGFDHRARLAVIRHVAAPLARDAQLPPKPVVFFDEHHPAPALGRRDGRQHAGRAAAHDGRVEGPIRHRFYFPPFRRRRTRPRYFRDRRAFSQPPPFS